MSTIVDIRRLKVNLKQYDEIHSYLSDTVQRNGRKSWHK